MLAEKELKTTLYSIIKIETKLRLTIRNMIWLLINWAKLGNMVKSNSCYPELERNNLSGETHFICCAQVAYMFKGTYGFLCEPSH